MFEGRVYLVLGIDTDIGKTFFIESICKTFLQNNLKIKAIKPVASGFSYEDKNSDSAKILRALNLDFSVSNLDLITPWRFELPSSPNVAAKKSGQKIDFAVVKNFCLEQISAAKKNDDFLVIESAGGVMTPLSDDKTFLDLADELKIPALLITANYLGSISHTLCAIEALKAKQIEIEKIIVNDFTLPNKPASQLTNEEFRAIIQSFSKIPATF